MEAQLQCVDVANWLRTSTETNSPQNPTGSPTVSTTAPGAYMALGRCGAGARTINGSRWTIAVDSACFPSIRNQVPAKQFAGPTVKARCMGMATESAHQRWTELYRLAVLETNLVKLNARVGEARAAINERMIELKGCAVQQQERQALADALKMLQLLAREAQNTNTSHGEE